MTKHPKLILVSLLCISTIAGTVVALVSLPAQKPDAVTSARDQAKGQYDPTTFPTTDYDKPEPSDSEKRTVRRIRSGRYKFKDNVDPKRFEITEQSQSGFGTFEIHAKPEPAIPAAQSDVIVVGEVTNAEAFLSSEKTSIYSEFTLKVNDVLKGISATVFPSASITATRGGGAVRFPSGRVVYSAFLGKPFPKTGRTYLFFLKLNNDGGSDFSIITAYELRDGHIFPLDGLFPRGEVVSQLAEHQKLSGTDEGTFLTMVRQAIAQAGSSLR